MGVGPDAYLRILLLSAVVGGVAVGDGRLLCLRSISDSCGRGLIGAAVSAVFTCWALMAAAAWLALSG
jgi:hypothetical protein